MITEEMNLLTNTGATTIIQYMINNNENIKPSYKYYLTYMKVSFTTKLFNYLLK